jgi:hypothetical protein
MAKVDLIRHFAISPALLALAGLTACGSAPPAPISVTFSAPPPSSVAVETTAAVAAIVSNDSLNGGVSWTVTCGSSDCGAVDPGKTASGSAATYTPPAAVPSPATVTITATSVTDHTKSVSGSTTIAPTGAPLLSDGTYVFHLSGTDANGLYTIAGAFSVARGLITGGEEDFSDPNGGYTGPLSPATSSINAAGGNIQIVLDTGITAIGVNGVETLRGTMVSPTRALLSEFDLSAAATGSVDVQTSIAALAGGYAFAVSGNDTNGNSLAIGGILDFSGTALSVTGSVFDISAFNPGTNTASVFQNQAFQSGSVTAPDAFGRVTFALTPNTLSGVPELGLAGYIVGTNRIELVESAEMNDALNANTGGSALGQGANTGTFSAASASVVNQSYAQASAGIDANNPVSVSGAFALKAGGMLGGTLAVNDLVSIGAWTIGGTYAVDPTGRVTASVTSLTSASAAPPASSLTFELYLDGNGDAMVIGADPFQATQGIAYEQGRTFNLAGNYALSALGVFPTANGGASWGTVGPVTVSAGSFGGTTDFTLLGATPLPAVALSGAQDVTGGLLQLTGLDANNFQEATSYGYYPLTGNRLWGLQADDQGISLVIMEAVTP